MATTNTRNRMQERKDDRNALWIVIALIVLTVLAYAAYANYYSNDYMPAEDRVQIENNAYAPVNEPMANSYDNSATGTYVPADEESSAIEMAPASQPYVQ